MADKSKRGRPLTMADLMAHEARIPREHGGPFRNVRMNITSAAAEPELSRILTDELAAFAAQGLRPGRPTGALDAKTKHIRALVYKYPKLSAKALRGKADEQILAGMKDSTFANKISEARAALRVEDKQRHG